MPCMKKVYKDKKATVHWSATGNEERIWPRGKNADEPRILFLHRFKLNFACSCFGKYVQDICAQCLGGSGGQLSFGRSDSSVPVVLGLASLPRRAPPRAVPPVVCPVFGFDRFGRMTVLNFA